MVQNASCRRYRQSHFYHKACSARGISSSRLRETGLCTLSTRKIGSWWSGILGGWPHDGFVPTTAQQYPGVPDTYLIGLSHTEETEDPVVISQIAQMAKAHH